MITLPKDWANCVGLKKNDTVKLQALPDGTLSIFPKGNAPAPKRSTKVIDVTNVNDHGFLYRQLVGAYIAGHATMLIKSGQPLSNVVTSAVNGFVQTSIGLEMIEADDSHMLVANLVEHDAIDPKKIIERMGLLVKSMMSDLYEAAYTGNQENITDMKTRDTEVDRIYWLTSRQCSIYQRDVSSSNKMGLSPSDMNACLSLSRVLENMGDHLITMSDYLILMAKHGNKPIVDKDSYRLGQKMNDLMTKAVRSWVEKDISLAEQTIKDADDIIRESINISGTNLVKDTVSESLQGLMFFCTKRLSEYCKCIAEFTFNSAME